LIFCVVLFFYYLLLLTAGQAVSNIPTDVYDDKIRCTIMNFWGDFDVIFNISRHLRFNSLFFYVFNIFGYQVLKVFLIENADVFIDFIFIVIFTILF